MMSQRNSLLPPSKQDQEITQSSTTRKPNSSTRSSHHPDSQSQQQDNQAALKCPRCDSTNTKFCYYNNYSLTQPRHFCKTCRRYWTKGGALRNVPIGGGCRKTKKLKTSSKFTSATATAAPDNSPFFAAAVSPSFDFQLGHPITPNHNHYSFMGLNYYNNQLGSVIQDYNTNNLASSIESLSSLNQDLHWKLQQQRLGMIFGSDDQQQKDQYQTQKLLQPILFQNLEVQKQDSCCNLSSSTAITNNNNNNPRRESTSDDIATTEWFFGSAQRNNGIGGSGSGWNNSGVQAAAAAAWEEDLHHYTALP